MEFAAVKDADDVDGDEDETSQKVWKSSFKDKIRSADSKPERSGDAREGERGRI